MPVVEPREKETLVVPAPPYEEPDPEKQTEKKKGTETGSMERKEVVVLKREEIKPPLGMTTTVPMEVRDRGVP